MDDDFKFPFEKVPIEVAREMVTEKPVKEEVSHLRAPPDPKDDALSDETIAWILGLHPAARPHALAKQFPRVVNILAKLWDSPTVFDARLAEYMLDDRGTRQGFPFEVAMELGNLKNISRLRSNIPDSDYSD